MEIRRMYERRSNLRSPYTRTEGSLKHGSNVSTMPQVSTNTNIRINHVYRHILLSHVVVHIPFCRYSARCPVRQTHPMDF